MGHREGFTILELLITLFIAAILLSSALPDFQQTVATKRAQQTLKTVIQAIEFSRIAAVTRSSIVTMCRSKDGQNCGGDWIDGLVIFSDENGNGKVDEDDELLRYITFPFAKGRLRWRAFQNKQYLQLTRLGFTNYQNGNFTYCPDNNDPLLAQQIIVNRLGRVRWATDSNGDGLRENSRGEPLTCGD